MLKHALSSSSSSSDDLADDAPRCSAPRWRLDAGDDVGLEASADRVLAALARARGSDVGVDAAARWTVAEVWAPAGTRDAMPTRVTPPASPLPTLAPPLLAAACRLPAPPALGAPPRRPRAPLELVVCRAREARRCVRVMRRNLHCCAGCVDDPLAAYVRKAFSAPVRDAAAVQVAAFATGRPVARAEQNWAARAAKVRAAPPALPAAELDGRVSPPRSIPRTAPVSLRPPRAPAAARTAPPRGAAAFAARLRWAVALPLLDARGDACGVLVLRFGAEDAPASTTTARRAVEQFVAAAAAASEPPSRRAVSDDFDEAADDIADGIIPNSERPLWTTLAGLQA